MKQDMLFQKMIEILSELWYDKYGIRFIGVHRCKNLSEKFFCRNLILTLKRGNENETRENDQQRKFKGVRR